MNLATTQNTPAEYQPNVSQGDAIGALNEFLDAVAERDELAIWAALQYMPAKVYAYHFAEYINLIECERDYAVKRASQLEKVADESFVMKAYQVKARQVQKLEKQLEECREHNRLLMKANQEKSNE